MQEVSTNDRKVGCSAKENQFEICGVEGGLEVMGYIPKLVARVESLRHPSQRRLGTYRRDRGTENCFN